MELLMENLPKRVSDNPECNRKVYHEEEWKLIKEAIDRIREDQDDLSARCVLIDYNLWDYEGNTQDEKQIKDLYMRYT